jgi:hypothetical protein
MLPRTHAHMHAHGCKHACTRMHAHAYTRTHAHGCTHAYTHAPGAAPHTWLGCATGTARGSETCSCGEEWEGGGAERNRRQVTAVRTESGEEGRVEGAANAKQSHPAKPASQLPQHRVRHPPPVPHPTALQYTYSTTTHPPSHRATLRTPRQTPWRR